MTNCRLVGSSFHLLPPSANDSANDRSRPVPQAHIHARFSSTFLIIRTDSGDHLFSSIHIPAPSRQDPLQSLCANFKQRSQLLRLSCIGSFAFLFASFGAFLHMASCRPECCPPPFERRSLDLLLIRIFPSHHCLVSVPTMHPFATKTATARVCCVKLSSEKKRIEITKLQTRARHGCVTSLLELLHRQRVSMLGTSTAQHSLPSLSFLDTSIDEEARS